LRTFEVVKYISKFAVQQTNLRRASLYIISVLIIASISCTVIFLFSVRGLKIKDGRRFVSLDIPTGSNYSRVFDSINSKILIKNKSVFNWLAERKNYKSSVKPGHYILTDKMSYLNIINVLRSGSQMPVKVTFNNVRTIYDIAGKIGNQIEADSLQITRFLSDNENYQKDGFSIETVISVFIPDTYEFYWNTSAEGLYKKMLKEYRRFWSADRLAKAREKNLSPLEVSVLASIIDEETSVQEEKPRIAGVYLNRLKQKIKLDADPTIKFALNDFTVTRILNRHLQVDSPYNTYKYTGLPPGPIRCPSIESIDAVLNAEKHEYLFFVAKADFSGYHYFSKTLSEHNRYAALYQKELDKRKIFR
jgi:UPF0755 protein